MTGKAKWMLAAMLVLVAAAVVGAGDQEPARGAKALFGQGAEEVFFPRDADRGSSDKMDPSSNVDENMLTKFYENPEFPGIAYSLEVIRRGESQVLTVRDPRSYEFQTGDRIRMRLVPNFNGFAYVLEDRNNTASLVYPASFGTSENRVHGGRASYVPAQGWLRLVDPAQPFTMRVLFRQGELDYRLNQRTPNPAGARVDLTEAVNREWQALSGSKGMVFETDESYIDVPATGPSAGRSAPEGGDSQAIQATNRTNYTTNYAVVDKSRWAPAGGPTPRAPAIAVEVPIRHVR